MTLSMNIPLMRFQIICHFQVVFMPTSLKSTLMGLKISAFESQELNLWIWVSGFGTLGFGLRI